jgi:hypothetical protein
MNFANDFGEIFRVFESDAPTSFPIDISSEIHEKSIILFKERNCFIEGVSFSYASEFDTDAGLEPYGTPNQFDVGKSPGGSVEHERPPGSVSELRQTGSDDGIEYSSGNPGQFQREPEHDGAILVQNSPAIAIELIEPIPRDEPGIFPVERQQQFPDFQKNPLASAGGIYPYLQLGSQGIQLECLHVKGR